MNPESTIEDDMSEICIAQSLLAVEIKRNPKIYLKYPKCHHPFSFRYSTRHNTFVLLVLGEKFQSNFIGDLFFRADKYLLRVGEELGYTHTTLRQLINHIQIEKISFDLEEEKSQTINLPDADSENRIYERLKKDLIEMIKEFKKK